MVHAVSGALSPHVAVSGAADAAAAIMYNTCQLLLVMAAAPNQAKGSHSWCQFVLLQLTGVHLR